MPAALRRDLILEHDGGKSRALVSLHRALDVLRAAEAGVAVSNQRDGDRTADVLSLVGELAIRDQAGVRHAEARGRDSEPAHEAELEAGFFDQASRHRVMAAGHHQDAGPLEENSQAFRWSHATRSELYFAYSSRTRRASAADRPEVFWMSSRLRSCRR